MSKILELKNVEKYYGNKSSLEKAVDNVSFDIEENEFVSIMGPSGSGKSTLLNVISTIDKVTSGSIKIDGQIITNSSEEALNIFRKDKLGFIFQEYNLLDTLTGYENIALKLSIQKVPVNKQKVIIENIAKELGLLNVLNKYPYQMSGGQKQRIAAARAIVSNPKLILADEPTGALDSKSSKNLLVSLEYLNRKYGSTILMVTHDTYSASYSNRVIFIKDGKTFNEIYRGDMNRKEFFNQIMDVVSLFGGEVSDDF